MARDDDILELDSDPNGSRLWIGIMMNRFNLNPWRGPLSYCTEELCKRGARAENDLIPYACERCNIKQEGS